MCVQVMDDDTLSNFLDTAFSKQGAYLRWLIVVASYDPTNKLADAIKEKIYTEKKLELSNGCSLPFSQISKWVP
jgi:urease accessory protein UreF